jgi:hypothetical protein
MPLQDLVNAALAERRDANYRRARADALLAAVIGEAERLRSTGVSVRELDSDQRIGTLRLDGANLPAVPAISDPGELASWLAERFPELVTASVAVPVGRLEEVLELLDMAGLRDVAEASVVPRDLAKTLAWLGEHCKVQADPKTPHTWNVLHVDSEGHTTPVPGTTAQRPSPTWKVLVDPALQADAKAVAQAEIEDLVRELREQDARDRSDDDGQQFAAAAREAQHDAQPPVSGIMRGPLERVKALSAKVDAALARRDEYAARTTRQLADELRERGLSTAGGKEARIDRLLESDGLVAPAPAAASG